MKRKFLITLIVLAFIFAVAITTYANYNIPQDNIDIIDEIKENIQELLDGADNADKIIKELEKQIKELEKDYNNLEKENQKLKADNNKLLDQNTNLISEVNQLKDQIISLENKIDEIHSDYGNELKEILNMLD